MTPVGAGLLANTVCHSAMMGLIYRFREQARSHRGDWRSFHNGSDCLNCCTAGESVGLTIA